MLTSILLILSFSYLFRAEVGSGPSYTLSGRTPTKLRNESPGPGAYQSSADPVSRKGPAYSIGGRSTEKLRNDNPGPGSYASNPNSTAPAFSLGGRYDQQASLNTPGKNSQSLFLQLRSWIIRSR
jgi:hypothetical protein